MTIIWSVLEEEENRLTSLVAFYEAKLSEYPKGYLSAKKRGSGVYMYLTYREGERVVSRYMGKERSEAVQEAERQITERKKVVQQLQGLKKSLKEVKRALKRQRI